jgi:ankyrin repeat protein
MNLRRTSSSPNPLVFAVLGCSLLIAGCNNGSPPAGQPSAVPTSNIVKPLTANESKLFQSIEGRDFTQVQLLVKEHPETLKAQGPLGTPLHRAAAGPGDAEITNYLLKAGADVAALDDRGNTPLNVAVRGRASKEKARIVELLLAKGADPDAKTRGGGSSPLHIAAFAGNFEVVKLLLTHKADVNATDGEGKTPLQRVTTMQKKIDSGDKTAKAVGKIFDMQNYPAIIKLLRAAGGK